MTANPTGQPAVIHRQTALFLDFDGTLSPLQDDPSAVHLPDGGAEVLTDLANRLGGAMALVSGRDARDLASRTPRTVWRAGNHGDIVLPPGLVVPDSVAEPPAALVAAVEDLVQRHDGAVLEKKARVLAIHTRKAPEHQEPIAKALQSVLSAHDDYHLQQGKDITELKPAGADKGAAIRSLMMLETFSGRQPLFIGDDTTDEDGFAVSIELGGSAIKVGEGDTIAPRRLDTVEDVWSLLKETLDDFA